MLISCPSDLAGPRPKAYGSSKAQSINAMNFRSAILTSLLVLLPLPGTFAETPREQLIQIIRQEFPAILAAQKDPAKREDEAFQKHVEEVEDRCNALMAEVQKTDPRPRGEIMQEVMFEALPEQRAFLEDARGRAQMVASMNNLKQIAMAYHMHLLDGEEGPAKLTGLLPHLGDNEKVLLSPAVKDREGRKTDYLYFGAGLKQADLDKLPAATTVLACDRLDNHGGKLIHAVFLDGHVESIELNDEEPLFGGDHAYLNKRLTRKVLQGGGE